MDDSRELIPQNCQKYYLTCTGKLWGVKKDELMEGDAQTRREIIGNSFDTPEEAAFAKAKLEAMNRLAPYAEKQLRVIDGFPAIITKYHLSKNEYNLLKGDLMILAKS